MFNQIGVTPGPVGRGRNTVRDESFSPRLDKARDC
jgi:hypothetical protein